MNRMKVALSGICAGAIAVAVGTTMASASAGATVASASAGAVAQDAPSSIVEDFSYPNAAAIRDARKIDLISGNGKIELTDCVDGGAGLIRVRSNVALPEFCFEVKGPQGFLSLRLEQVYQIRGDGEHDIDAEINARDVNRTVDVPLDTWAIVGVSAGEGPAVLLELRSA